MPNANRKSKIENWADADRAMAELATVDAALRMVMAERDKAQAAIVEKYFDSIDRLCGQAKGLEESLKKFAAAHKQEFKATESGGDGRSHSHAGVEMGFRRTPPAVRIEDEEKALKWLESAGPNYVRTVPEINRELLKEDLASADELTVNKFAGHGISLRQTDKWFCEVQSEK